MKLITIYFAIVALSILTACGPETQPPMIEKGQRIAVRASVSMPAPLSATLAAPEIDRAVIVSPVEGVQLVELVDGVLEADVPLSSVSGLFFIRSDDSYAGYLSLGDDIDSLPTTKLQTGLEAIELGELTLSGDRFVPAQDVFAEQLPLSLVERAALAQSDNVLAALIKNADADNDGVLDVLTGSWYGLHVRYAVKGGEFGLAQTQAVTGLETGIDWARVQFRAYGAARPSTVGFTGPSFLSHDYYPGQVFSELNPMPPQDIQHHAEYSAYESLFVNGAPLGGVYKVKFQSTALAFELPDQSTAKDSILIPVPRVTVSSDGRLERVTWIFANRNGLPADPASVIAAGAKPGLQLKLYGTSASCATNNGVAFQTELPLTTSGEVALGCSIEWRAVRTVAFHYTDVYGNSYEITFLNRNSGG
ncbi:MAG TPA: hypothetical protein VFV50_06315 [Bdellovibrionales bacterium]|nr:hypothetical protein [Bdellovibrionales bacterium]